MPIVLTHTNCQNPVFSEVTDYRFPKYANSVNPEQRHHRPLELKVSYHHIHFDGVTKY